MNIYDFDNTIIKGDSTVKFMKYSFLRHPFLVTKSVFLALKEFIKAMFHHSNLTNIKSNLLSFVKYINNFDDYIDKFVLKCQKDIKKFYLEQKKDNDVIISASPDFLIKPLGLSLGIKNVIATKYDIKKGCIIGLNCKGEEKVKRFKELYKDAHVLSAYSDSLSDIPMFKLAKKAYLVKNDYISEYVEK